MNRVAIIADSAVDLNAELRAAFGIADYVHGVVVKPDGSQFLADDDWANITPEEYFGSMTKGRLIYHSATCSAQEVEDVFKKHLTLGEDILGITIGSAFSGMYNLFQATATRLAPKYPKRHIVIVDSTRYSGAYALLCLKAHDLLMAGKSLEQTATYLEENKNRIHQMGPLDDLFFLNRSGRISKTIAVMGTMVGIRPLADFQKNGFCQPLGKVKGMNHALETSVLYVQRSIENPKTTSIIVAHSDRKAEAVKYAALLQEKIHPQALYLTSVGQISGANIGPGLVAAFYFGDAISEGDEKEKKLLEAILKGN
jgi:DegV family protein with EDD domain